MTSPHTRFTTLKRHDPGSAPESSAQSRDWGCVMGAEFPVSTYLRLGVAAWINDGTIPACIPAVNPSQAVCGQAWHQPCPLISPTRGNTPTKRHGTALFEQEL